jgi:hypothetical protein
MFVNRNYFSFFGPLVSYLIIYKTHKTQWNSREGTANSSRVVYWAKVTQQLTLSRRYSQFDTNRCCRLCSWTEVPLYLLSLHFQPPQDTFIFTVFDGNRNSVQYTHESVRVCMSDSQPTRFAHIRFSSYKNLLAGCPDRAVPVVFLGVPPGTC